MTTLALQLIDTVAHIKTIEDKALLDVRTLSSYTKERLTITRTDLENHLKTSSRSNWDPRYRKELKEVIALVESAIELAPSVSSVAKAYNTPELVTGLNLNALA